MTPFVLFLCIVVVYGSEIEQNGDELVKVSKFYGCHTKKLGKNLRLQPVKEEYDINDEVTFSCENGLTLVGERISHCAGFNMWNTDDPICTTIECPPDVIDDAYTTYQFEQIANDQMVVAYYTCHDNSFEPVPHKRTCGHHDQWDANIPTCRPRCDPPMRPANGSVVAVCHYDFCKAHYRCDRGFVMMGDEEGECQHHKWQFFSEPPQCHEVLCDLAPTVDHGQAYYMYHKISGSYSVSARVEYKCDFGFSPVNGTEVLICDNNNRTWSGLVPECVHDTLLCPSDTLENGRVERADGKATYTCDFGFRVEGDSVRECQGQAGWSGRKPQCVYSPPCIDPNKVRFAAKIMKPTQVNKVYRYAFGSEVTYECLQNQSQSVTQKCNESGLWEGEEAPKCLNPKFLNATNFRHAWRNVFSQHQHWVGGFTINNQMSTFEMFVMDNQNWTGLYLRLAIEEKTGGQMLLNLEYHNQRFIVTQQKLVESGDFFSDDFDWKFEGFLLKEEDDKRWHFYSLNVAPDVFKEVHMIARDDGKHFQPQFASAPHKRYTSAAFVILTAVSVTAFVGVAFILVRRRNRSKKTPEHQRVVTSFENPIYSSDATKPLTETLPQADALK